MMRTPTPHEVLLCSTPVHGHDFVRVTTPNHEAFHPY